MSKGLRGEAADKKNIEKGEKIEGEKEKRRKFWKKKTEPGLRVRVVS